MGRALFHRLSNRLLVAVLSASLVMGMLLSIIQIMLDARSARAELEQQSQAVLAMMQEPATQSAFNLDRHMALQVVKGLFQNESVVFAAINIPDEPPLAIQQREPVRYAYRFLSNILFGRNLHYELPLNNSVPIVTTFGVTPSSQLQQTTTPNSSNTFSSKPIEVYGNLQFTIDPAAATQQFIVRSTRLILSGLLQATGFGLVLYMIFQALITRPMSRMIKDLESIDPIRPSRVLLAPPKGHEKDEIGLWVNKVNHLFHSIENHHNQRRVAEAHVERLSNYDMLTELPNRSLLIKKINDSILQTERSHPYFAIICFSLDDFKTVNLLHSYQTGDKLLLALSDRLKSQLERAETIARVSGDVFALILPDVNSHLEVAKFSQSLLNCIRQPFLVDGQEVSISASIGITLYPDDGVTPEELLKNAENVMRLAKNQGGNRYQFYIESIDQKLRDNKRLEKNLLQALEQNQMRMVYQPLVDLKTKRIVGAEALLRWMHPERGLISPVEFVPMAEQNQSIVPIGEWVINEACRTLKIWQTISQNYEHLTISINVSAVQLQQSNLVDRLRNMMERYRLKPANIILEITETAVMTHVDSAIQLLRRLKETGVQIAIDDFGTGYSSLSYLKQMPLDKLKIDGSFISSLTEENRNSTIVDTVIKLGHSLNLSVIAEGVEDIKHVSQLKHLKCDLAQGYYFSEPVAADEFLQLLRRESESQQPESLAIS